jgi:hypothetical protein
MPRLSKPVVLVAALAALAVALAARAQTVPDSMTIDAVEPRIGEIRVTGVVQGATTPSTRIITWAYASGTEAQKAQAYEACHRQLLLALARPGQYVVRAGPATCNVALLTP